MINATLSDLTSGSQLCDFSRLQKPILNLVIQNTDYTSASAGKLKGGGGEDYMSALYTHSSISDDTQWIVKTSLLITV